METFMRINESINSFVWGPVMLVLLVGCGIYMSARTGFLQFRRFGFVIKNTLGTLTDRARVKDGNNVSPFQAVSTALASTIGTGSIVGVATAITLGGPGAVFWMWFSAAFGMMTKYSEILLSLKYREKNEWGQYAGGPMYYLKNGLKCLPLAYFFAFIAAVTTFGTGNMTQSNAISNALLSTFGVPLKVSGALLVLLVVMVIFGGINNIVKVTEKLVPFMAIFFLILSTTLIVINGRHVPEAFVMIFNGAFRPQSAFGGAAGWTVLLAIRSGIARGVFSNEAGLGSAPIAHAASSTKEPVEQAIWGIFEVGITIVICTMMALVILTTGSLESGMDGAALSVHAFNTGLPGNIGGIGVTLALVMFALSTLLGWSYYGEKCVEFLFRFNLRARKYAILIYRILYCICVFLGSVGGLKLIWAICDTMNGLMAIPNLIGVIGLSGVVIKETKSYFERRKKGEI